MTRFLEPARAAHAFALAAVGEGETLRGYRGDAPESLLGRWYRCALSLLPPLPAFRAPLTSSSETACCTRRSARSSSTSSRRSPARSSSRSARHVPRCVPLCLGSSLMCMILLLADTLPPCARRSTSRSSASSPRRFRPSTTSGQKSLSSSSASSTRRSPSRALRSSTRSSRTSRAEEDSWRPRVRPRRCALDRSLGSPARSRR